MKNLNHEAVKSILPDRKVDSHKGDFGKLLLLWMRCVLSIWARRAS